MFYMSVSCVTVSGLILAYSGMVAAGFIEVWRVELRTEQILYLFNREMTSR